MGNRIETWQNGKLISVHDDRVFSEEQLLKKLDVNIDLFNCLAKTDWYLSKLIDPTAVEKVDEKILNERSMYRKQAEAIKKSIDEATEFAVLDKIASTLDKPKKKV